MKNKYIDKFNPTYSNELYGYNTLLKDLVTLSQNENIPKVLMFSGEKGLGKFTLALHFITYFFTSKEAQYPYDFKNKIIHESNIFYNSHLW